MTSYHYYPEYNRKYYLKHRSSCIKYAALYQKEHPETVIKNFFPELSTIINRCCFIRRSLQLLAENDELRIDPFYVNNNLSLYF